MAQTIELVQRPRGWQWAVSEEGKVIDSSPPTFADAEAATAAARDAYPEAQVASELPRPEG